MAISSIDRQANRPAPDTTAPPPRCHTISRPSLISPAFGPANSSHQAQMEQSVSNSRETPNGQAQTTIPGNRPALTVIGAVASIPVALLLLIVVLVASDRSRLLSWALFVVITICLTWLWRRRYANPNRTISFGIGLLFGYSVLHILIACILVLQHVPKDSPATPGLTNRSTRTQQPRSTNLPHHPAFSSPSLIPPAVGPVNSFR